MKGRHITLAAVLAGSTLIAVPALTGHAPRLIWNVSASVPIGLYTETPADHIEIGDLVAVRPTEELADFLDTRGYLPLGVPLIKRVLALPGAEVCRHGMTITADGRASGNAQTRDRLGRDLPVWQGCRVIADGEVFLMNRDASDSLDGRYFGPLPLSSITARLGRDLPRWQGCRMIAQGGEVFLMNRDVPDSLDGRYFGPLPVTSVVARLVPIWTDEDGDGRFEWRVSTR